MPRGRGYRATSRRTERPKAGEMDWNEPMHVEGRRVRGKTGILLIHGFGGSPRSLQELGERCVDADYSVALPLLRGHGLTALDMEASRWTEWTGDVERAYQWLRVRTDRIFVCGLSMGGTLALWCAEHHPEVVGLVTINAIVRHPLEPVMLTAGRFRIPRWLKPIANDARMEGVDERAYERLPMRSTYELSRLCRNVRPRLADITCPALVFSSAVDHVVPPANQRKLHDALGSSDKTFVELKDCYHLATMDCEKETVFTGILEFVAAHVPS
jgi:carboxylesterase